MLLGHSDLQEALSPKVLKFRITALTLGDQEHLGCSLA